MEGPAFSTLAESNLYRSWGMDVIGMTNLQEAKLAREAEICYTTIAMVTDYDCWHPDHDAVTVNDIIANLTQNAANAAKLVAEAVRRDARSAHLQMRIGAGARPDHRSQDDSRGHSQKAGAAGWKVLRVSYLAQDLLDSCIAGKPPARTCRAHCWRAPCAAGAFRHSGGGTGRPLRTCPVRCLRAPVLAGNHGQDPAELVARYERVRRTRRAACEPTPVLVLSRVTLGADVAVTSVLLAAAKQRFPKAEIVFAGPRKNYELFAADGNLTHAAIEYRRGSLHERLAVWDELKALAAAPGCLVLDPDSRLTQLGLLPIGAEDRYHLFESRAFGGESDLNLPALAARWSQETLGVSNAAPYVAVGQASGPATTPYISVSLGVGENPAKRIPDPFESDLLALLSARLPLVIDRGVGGEEAARAERAVTESGARATFWEGSFAGFAQVIAGSSLYLGYDSAGQHVAAACGVPLISIFAGFPAPRMFHRWRPSGPHATVIRVDQTDPTKILAQVAYALG